MKKNIFSVTADSISNVSVLYLNGSLDAHTSIILEEQIQHEINKESYKIILDFTNLEYISSAGLGVFMVFVEYLRKNNGDLVFVKVPEKVLNILTLLGFNEIFHIADSIEVALKLFEMPDII